MKTYLTTIAALSVFFLLSVNSYSQSIITGTVVDSASNTPLNGANILITGANRGTVSDLQGNFRLTTPQGAAGLRISLVGYRSHTEVVNIKTAGDVVDLGKITMTPSIIGLNEIRIISSAATDRKTPVSVSTIKADIIQRQTGDNPFPEVMKMVPGVYTTRTGGGSGDANVNIRGFKQENVALLLNGVPINSVENGLVYWNNWIGLTDITRQLQVQRGLGVSNVALNSVGGTINIITKTTEAEQGGSFKYDIASYGNYKATFSYSTGRMENGLAVTFLGSRFKGPGYVDATYVDGWAYFLSLSKDFGQDHKLVFTSLGNPERHGQRNFRLSVDEYRQYGLKYNKDWGGYNGKIKNASENFYHKPHFSLNHYWDISEKSFLATSAYFSFGYGGGKWTDTFGNNPWIFSYYNPSGQIDWERIHEVNANNTDTFTLATGKDTTRYSVNVQTNFLASHVWTGVLSTFRHSFNDKLELMAGIHGRYFKSKLQQKVRDLLGGGFYIDDYAFAVDGVAGRDQVKHVGDIVKVNNGAMVNYIGGFAQLEYNTPLVSAFLSGTLNHTWYRRDDRYNYVDNIYSPAVTQPGFDLKAGINFNINEYNNVFVNGGYFSKAPYYKFVFAGFNNTPTRDLRNEKVQALEAGYGLNYVNTRVRVSAYLTLWSDKSIITNEYNQFEDPSMVQGLNAEHKGIEFEISQQVGNFLEIGGLISIGDWKWKNDVSALLLSNENVVVDTVEVYANGLYVGDAPQTQLGLFASLKILRMFDLTGNWIYYDRMYADFSPTTRTDPSDTQQPYRIPSWHSLDLHLGFPFTIGSIDLYGNISCFNVLDHEYIIRGEDGPRHNLQDFRGFWGFGRNFNFSLKMSF